MQQELVVIFALVIGAAPLVWWFLRRKTEAARIRREFNTVFSVMSKQGKQDLIERWMTKKKCSRGEAMRLAVEDWRSDRANR
jgi:hypothetical protein